MYGHLDKQPEMVGWREGSGPWKPVIDDGKLYGRGGADDGYAVFASLAAIRALQEQKRPHGRIAILIECCEESGSYDLPAYLEALSEKMQSPDLVDRPRLGLRQLRAALEHDLAARPGERRAHGGGADRGRALGRRERRGGLELPHRAHAARSHRRRRHRHRQARRLPRADPAERADAGEARRRGARRGDLAQVPVRAGHAADAGRPRRPGAQPHLAAVPRRDRRRRPAGAGERRQRAAPEDQARALAAPAADGEGRQRGAAAQGDPRGRSALRRARDASSPARPAPAGTRRRPRRGWRRR